MGTVSHHHRHQVAAAAARLITEWVVAVAFLWLLARAVARLPL